MQSLAPDSGSSFRARDWGAPAARWGKEPASLLLLLAVLGLLLPFPAPPRPRLGLGLRGDTQRGGGPSPRRGPQASLLPPFVLARAGVAFRDPGPAFSSLRPIWTLAQGRLEGRGGRVPGAPRAAMSPSAALPAQEGNRAGQAPGCSAPGAGLCGAAAGGRRAWFPCAGVIKRLLSGQLLCVSSASRRSVLWRPGHAPCSSHGPGQRPPLHASPRSSH